jgi:hypothetical protein
MQQRTASQQSFVDEKIDQVLEQAALPLDSPLRGLLNRDCEVFDAGREFGIRVPHADRDLSLAEHLETFRENSMFRHNFAAARPAVDKRDMRGLSENFDAILSGKTVVR